MSDQQATFLIEIPSNIGQQEVWDVEESLSQVEGVTTELQEPKDPIATTLLFLHIVGPHLSQATTIAGGIKATYNIAQIIYKFLHPGKEEKADVRGKNKVVINKKGKKIELYNLSTEEIKKVLETQ